QMLPDVVLGCLNQIIPDRVPAEGTSCLWNPVLLGGHGLTDDDYGDATPFAMNTFHSGGTGARPGKDGLNATAFPSGVRNTPIEINETIAPLIFWKKEYRTDSGGAGIHRGGVGQIMQISHAEDAPFAINTMFDRVIHPPRGRNGGANGMTGRLYLTDGTELNGKGRQSIPAGQRITIEMPGGGGLGDPASRDAESLASDVLNGFVSDDQAKAVYGLRD
ncbi:MAG: hydantoinase B/oxoprolinase family protein, partial [Alphaproteobacteria bacterium]|nr:hydantoinase B/oxoprolinase family protein [Alphaproteobacteria bacterium]